MTSEELHAAVRNVQHRCLAILPMSAEEIADIYTRSGNILRPLYQKMCLSHERLRTELSGSEILIRDLEAEIELLKQRLSECQAAENE